MSHDGKDEIHVGVHTIVESPAPEIMPLGHEQPATNASVSAVSAPVAAKGNVDPAPHANVISVQQSAPQPEELIPLEASKQSAMEPAENGSRLTSLPRIVPTVAVLPASATVPALAASAATPAHHGDSQPQTQAPSATPAAPTVAANLPASPGNPTPPPAGAPPMPMPVADQLTRAFVAHADIVGQQGRTDFHLRLDPPQLGSVRIHLTATDNTVSARIVTAQEGTQQLLQNQAHHLRQGLAQAGLSLGSFDVTRDGGGSGGGRQAPPEPPLSLPVAVSPTRTSPVVSPPLHRPTAGIDILA